MRPAPMLALLLAASFAVASAGPSQPEGAQGSSSPVQVPNVQVVGVSQAQPMAEVGAQPMSVEVVHQPAGAHAHMHEHHDMHDGHHEHPHPAASYYAPAGIIQVVGEQSPVVGAAGKPAVGAVRNFEQYGQPESASIPPNYKPFGSWGLYIGGNPADGYYTNYYKALSNSVDKQQAAAGEGAKPAGQSASLSPILRQAGSSPYNGGDYYPFAYSPSDLNSGARVSVEHAHPHQPAPMEAGALSYADAYATKKLGSSAPFAQKEVQAPKGYQARYYAYPMASPMAQHQSAAMPQHQVVAYPVPVGSQIVGSQQGVDGAFAPYGVHAFTRYAVKPTVVSSADPSYYYSVGGVSSVFGQSSQAQAQQQPQSVAPIYKQSSAGVQQASVSAYSPMSFYGYPLSQLHYSQGQVVGPMVYSAGEQLVGAGQPVQHSPAGVVAQVGPNQVEAASEKSESEDKSSVNKQQQKKRA